MVFLSLKGCCLLVLQSLLAARVLSDHQVGAVLCVGTMLSITQYVQFLQLQKYVQFLQSQNADLLGHRTPLVPVRFPATCNMLVDSC